jgi:hypothetical protein
VCFHSRQSAAILNLSLGNRPRGIGSLRFRACRAVFGHGGGSEVARKSALRHDGSCGRSVGHSHMVDER